MLKSCFFWKILPFLIQCGFGRGKQPAYCGKSSSKYFHDFILRILIYTESIKTKSRKRQVIHWFQRIFLRFSLYLASEVWQVLEDVLNLDKYFGDGDGDYVHVDEPLHVHVLSNHLHLFLIFLDYELSLIHIWRCRRSYLCRSRWSPYH